MSSAVEITALTIEEAAPLLKVAPKTLRRWLREGAIPGVKVGRKWLVRADVVEQALTHGRRGDHAVWVPAPEPEASVQRPRLAPPDETDHGTPSSLPPSVSSDLRKPALVQRIRAMKAQGLSLQKIANQLNAEGELTLSHRGTWKKGTVGNLLAEVEENIR
jgi:excisionase family DNA binding protein